MQLPVPAQPVEKHKHIAAHTRRVTPKDGADTGESLPFFDESKVPVQSIVLVHADVKDLQPDEFEVIGEKITYRLAQRPGPRVGIAWAGKKPFTELTDYVPPPPRAMRPEQ